MIIEFVIMAGVTLIAIIGNEWMMHHDVEDRRERLHGLLQTARFLIDMDELERAWQVETELQKLKAEMGLDETETGTCGNG